MVARQEVRVQWFLDFMQADLKKLTFLKRAILASEIDDIINVRNVRPWKGGKAYFKESFENFSKTRLEGLLGVSSAVDLEGLQDSLRPHFDKIMSGIEGLDSLSSNGWVSSSARSTEGLPFSPKTGVALLDAIDCTCNMSLQASNPESISDLPPEKLIHPPLEDRADDTKIQFIPMFKTSHHALLFWFYRSLEDFPVAMFGRCRECGTWFVRSGHRARNFCSNRCASKFGIRQRRKEGRVWKGGDDGTSS